MIEEETGDPIPHEDVVAQNRDAQYIVVTRADGSYVIEDVAPGSYVVGAGFGVQPKDSVWAVEYYDGVRLPEEALQVSVVGGSVTTVDLELSRGGVLSGTVSHAWTGEPVADVSVNLRWRHPLTGDWYDSMAVSRTDETGRYELVGLAGEYVIRVFRNEFHDYQSAPLTIEPGSSVAHEIVITPSHGDPSASIAGVACVLVGENRSCRGYEDGEPIEPIPYADVEVVDDTGSVIATTATNGQGWFDITGLTPGTLTVRLAGPTPGLVPGSEQVFTLGPNEGTWDAELGFWRAPVRYTLGVSVGSSAVTIGQSVDLDVRLEAEPVDPTLDAFDVSDVVVRLQLDDDLKYVRHSSDGRYVPETGSWHSALTSDSPAELSVAVRPTEVGTYTVSAEVQSSLWPDPEATFGDGRGDDHSSVTLVVEADNEVEAGEPPGEAIGVQSDGDDGNGINGLLLAAAVLLSLIAGGMIGFLIGRPPGGSPRHAPTEG